MSLENNIALVCQKISEAAIRAGRDPKSIELIAISKTFPSEKIAEAQKCGIRSFGENYVQEALDKMEKLQDADIEWHFVGHLQSKKVKSCVGRFTLLHSLDSQSVVQELQKRVPDGDCQRVLVQVQFVPEETKSGVLPADVPEFLAQVQKTTKVRLEGLMVMPPLDMPISEKRSLFRRVKQKQEEWKSLVKAPHKLDVLSMGTTHDFELAIEEGSTMVRIGSALFGERKAE